MLPPRLNKVDVRQKQAAASSKYGVVLTPDIFSNLDADNSGAIDLQELKALFGAEASEEEVEMLMLRADLDGNGVIDYAEYERLMRMQGNGDTNGGNLWVRNAIKLKHDLMASDSIIRLELRMYLFWLRLIQLENCSPGA